MKNKLTKKWLKKHKACEGGYEYAVLNLLGLDIKETLQKLMSDDKFNWGNWYLTRLFTKEQSVKYAIFAAEQVIGIYEKQYPKDDRPRKAIEAAKNPSVDAADAARAADAAASATATATAAAAAYAAARAARAAYAADAALADADAAAAAAETAAYAAALAADAAADADAGEWIGAPVLKTKIINFGLDLILERS